MYIIDVIRRLFQKNNWVVLVYMVLNIVVSALFIVGMGMFLTMIFTQSVNFESFPFWSVFGWASLVLLVIYLLSLLVILSPLGEFAVRMKYKCKKIERVDQINFLERIYREVVEQARAVDEHLRDNARIYITESQETTVFALGRRTLSFTSGIFQLPEEKIKALVARELGHIAQKDTDFLLLVMAGGYLVNACIWLMRIMLYICLIPVFAVGGVFFLVAKIAALVFNVAGGEAVFKVFGTLIDWICKPVPWLAKKLFELVNWFGRSLLNIWRKIGVAMILKTRSGSEFSADEFAFNCGYGDVLCEIILNDDLADQSEGIFKEIVRAYPANDSRIAKLQELGVEYSAY